MKLERIFQVVSVVALAKSSSALLTTLGCPTPATISGFNDTKLPNPFKFDNGRPVITKDDWSCRRSQISSLIAGYEAGDLPPKPQKLSANFEKSSTGANATLTIIASEHGKSINWTAPINYPSGTAPKGGWPLVIAYDGLSIPVPSNIATLIYPNSQIGIQNDNSSRGTGLFFDLYGQNATASSMTAWVWGVSRTIDILERMPSADINTKKIAVTGCSRDGKGALMAGAFEPRIALTIPQESGSGGDTCWRLSKYEQDSGSVVQTATEIVMENVWFSNNFANYVNDLSQLPYDHHFLLAMVAPRGLVSFENTDYLWLSPLSAWGCVSAARTVFEALGVKDHHGFAQVGGHAHCAWPDDLTPTLNAFFDKFLLDQPNTNTSFFSTNADFYNVTYTASNWTNWATPKLL